MAGGITGLGRAFRFRRSQTMVITRVQAFAIALGLALVGVAAAHGDVPFLHSVSDLRADQSVKVAPTGIDAAFGIGDEFGAPGQSRL